MMTSEKRPGRPRDAEAGRAIERATREILLESGYTDLTIEGVAERAAVAKTTVYRRWPTKGDLVLDATAGHLEIGLVPDTGSTRSDLEAAVEQLISTFSDPLARKVILAAVAGLDSDPSMAESFRRRWVYPWRQSAREALERADRRGDLPPDSDLDLLLDIVVGTVFQRTITMVEPDTRDLIRCLVDLISNSRTEDGEDRS